MRRVPPPFYRLTSSIVPFVCTLLLVVGFRSERAGAQGWSNLPSEDFRWQRGVPAGPYSLVNTASGTLITSITLVRLRGPGSTVLDFTLTHVSNNASTNRIGQVARGWRHTFDEWVVPNATYEAQRNSPGGKLDWWYQDPVPGGLFERRPGVRDDLAKLTDPTRYVATHKDQTQATYGYNRSGTYCLTEFKDTHNNALNVTYDGSGRVQTVTDAAGRSLTLTWNPSNQYAPPL